MNFWVEASELWIADGERVLWHGRPDSKPVLTAEALLGSEDAIVLLDPEAGPRNASGSLKGWPHLLRVDASGRVIWRAEAGNMAGEPDWWVALRLKGEFLEANTWSGYLRILDPTTGSVRSSVFTK